MKRVSIRKIIFGIVTFLLVLIFFPTHVCAASNDYRHLSAKISNSFVIYDLVDGKMKSTIVDARISDIDIKLDGESVRLQSDGRYCEDSDGKYIEYKSKVGYDKLSSLEFGEKSTIDIFGELAYSYNNERYITEFHKSFQALKKNNKCKAEKGSISYGFDLVCSKEDIQSIINSSIVNISKKWEKNNNIDKTTVIIYQNDEKFETVELTKEAKWAVSVKGLPVGERLNSGKWVDYKYSIKEIKTSSKETSTISYNAKKNVFEIIGKSQANKKNNDVKSEDEGVYLSDSDKKDCFNDGYCYEDEEQNDSAWLGLEDDNDVYTAYTSKEQKEDKSPNTADTSMIYPVLLMIVSTMFAMLYIWSYKKEEIKNRRKKSDR